jgi:SAM-dependent methyltransferase
MGISITQLYRKYISKGVRDKIYKLFLGRVLVVLRNPRIYLWLYRNYRNKKKLDKFLSLFLDKTGLEIGGGTSFFSNLRGFPIYLCAKSVDGCNFSNETIWEGHIGKGGYSYNNRLLGKQFICEATNVHKYINTEYDFIISSHCLEHTANPLKAIMSWRNVLKQNGIILLILPNKQANFDHRRYYTSFTHILDDYNNQKE